MDETNKNSWKDWTVLHLDNIVFIMFLALLWENIEHYLETIASQTIVYWFHGVEHWANRIIFDNLCVLIGYFIAFRFRKVKYFGRIFSVLWLVSHIFLFPHSMYLHNVFPAEFPPIWGMKQESYLDFWSIEHIITGIALGTFILWFEKKYLIRMHMRKYKEILPRL